MSKSIIRLSEFTLEDIFNALPERHVSRKEMAKNAYHVYLTLNLRFNVNTMTVFAGSDWLSKHSQCKDMNIDELDVLHDEFMPWINNSISRQVQGYSVI